MEKGKTIWEMIRGHGSAGKPEATPVYDPLTLVPGEPYRVLKAQYAGRDFVVNGLYEYTRSIGGKNFVFTDYELESEGAGDTAPVLKVRLRVMPDDGGTKTTLFLRLFDDLAYDKGLESVVRDTTRIFEVAYAEGDLDGRGLVRHDGEKDVYNRVNNLADSYKVSVKVLTKAALGKSELTTATVNLEYWDYTREFKERDAVERQFLFVEMNAKTGWFQIWQGEIYGGA